MTKDILFLLIALLALIIVFTLTIIDAINLFHELYSSRAHSGRIRGESGANNAGRVCIDGMWYNVEWIIKGEEGVIYNEERD